MLHINCAGLRDDFGVRTKSAIAAMREAGADRSTHEPKKGRGRLELLQNKGVAARAQRDMEELEVPPPPARTTVLWKRHQQIPGSMTNAPPNRSGCEWRGLLGHIF